jgi:glycosyltransferase involved in cell wall biosynthesis
VTLTVQADPPSPTIAVAIPCYNEAAAIGIVIASFRQALPSAEIVVFDNNSTDETAARALAEGARVIPVPDQGKGYAVRAAFSALGAFDVVVLTDGDGTYPAEAASRLVATVIEGPADMAVGARRPAPGAGAMSLVREFGNRLIRSAFWLLIGPGNSDLLSGYRVFNRRFRETVVLRSKGFEIEAELASEAIARKLRVVEISVDYHPRVAGTQSKLRAVRDGLRIMATILMQSVRLRPARPCVLWLVVCVLIGVAAVGPSIAVVAGLGLIVLLSLMVVDIRLRHREARKPRAPTDVEASFPPLAKGGQTGGRDA